MSRLPTGRFTPSAAAARIVSRRAIRNLPGAVSDVTSSEMLAAGTSVRAGVEEMPDLMRAGFVAALMLSLIVPHERMFAVAELSRFGRGLALAAVFDARAGRVS